MHLVPYGYGKERKLTFTPVVAQVPEQFAEVVLAYVVPVADVSLMA